MPIKCKNCLMFRALHCVMAGVLSNIYTVGGFYLSKSVDALYLLYGFISARKGHFNRFNCMISRMIYYCEIRREIMDFLK